MLLQAVVYSELCCYVHVLSLFATRTAALCLARLVSGALPVRSPSNIEALCVTLVAALRPALWPATLTPANRSTSPVAASP
jgi:hypothetical protein